MRIVRKGCRDDEQTIIIKGEPGPAGEAATIEIGTVTTLEPEDEAYVINTGDENAAVLNFGIPKGAAGNQGIQGPAGDDGADGADGADGTAATIEIGTVTTLEAGEQATVVNAGDENAAVLNFGIPKGAKGDQGDPGTDGTAATIQIGTVITLEPGEQAYAENVGSEEAAVLNFGIPRGQDGSGGGGGDSVYMVIMEEGPSLTYTMDKSAEEIIAAAEDGKPVLGYDGGRGLLFKYYGAVGTTGVLWHEENSSAMFDVMQTGTAGTLMITTVHDNTKQNKNISDAGGYFTTDTVEGALQEIGATLDGLDAALAALL